MSLSFPMNMTSLSVSLTAAMLAVTHRAEALVSVGAEAGISQRAVDYTDHLYTGFAFGVDADLDAATWVKIGPYYLHYEIELPEGVPWFTGGAYNTLGLQCRLVLPIPGKLKPYVHAGVGKTWVVYRLGTLRTAGSFVELPVGVGASYEATEMLSITFDAAYRPAVLFVGDAYDGDGYNPYAGTSFLLGVSLHSW